jgi:GAF domain-containing protein
MGPGEGTTPEGVGRSEAILRAVAHAVRVLASAPSWSAVADEVLGRLGEAAGVSRAYLFENSTSPEGVLLMTEVNEWCALGITRTITDPENRDFPYAGDFQRYVKLLGTGEALWGLTTDFPDAERRDMEDEGILATAFVPVFVGEDWWGFVGFDDCVTERAWTDLEIEALKAAAETLGAAMQRERVEMELRDAEWRFRRPQLHVRKGVRVRGQRIGRSFPPGNRTRRDASRSSKPVYATFRPPLSDARCRNGKGLPTFELRGNLVHGLSD